MLLRFRLPKTLLWVFNLLVIFLLMFTGYRLLTLLAFMPEGEHWSELVPSFFLGLRFDLRWISIILLPIIVASLLPEFSPFYSPRNRKIWTWYLAFMLPYMTEHFGNPSSIYSYGRETRMAIENARKSVAKILGVKPGSIFFTSVERKVTIPRSPHPSATWAAHTSLLHPSNTM